MRPIFEEMLKRENFPFCVLLVLAASSLVSRMADVALASKSKAPLFTESGLKALIGSILVYWGIYALIAPVTNSDSHVYNLARLSVVERGASGRPQPGIDRQVIFPWTFDAIHYPFLKAGWGFALPSFLAFLGLLIIIFELIASKLGSKAGLWSVLMLAMPTVMLQATTTKNDLVIAFGVGCWLYSIFRARESGIVFFFSPRLSA